MIDIFNGYSTGNREWTFSRKRFTEHEFRTAFFRLLPNDILHDAALAFLFATHVDVMNFSVPMANQVADTNYRRNVLFVQRPGSDYWTMFSFMWIQRVGVVEGLVSAFAENAHTGNMSEYDILDMIEPMNDAHQWALMETWFDINNWFDILRRHDLETNRDIDTIENITNGRAPRDLDVRADEFVPELADILQAPQIQAAHAAHAAQQQDVRILIENWDWNQGWNDEDDEDIIPIPVNDDRIV